ncbi:helix-turn-helix transcriptional regulator [Eubacterium aggregans]
MGNRIKEFRQQKRITQEELAEKSKVSRAIISGLESGRTGACLWILNLLM